MIPTIKKGNYEYQVFETDANKAFVIIKVPFDEFQQSSRKRIIDFCNIDENKYDVYFRSLYEQK